MHINNYQPNTSNMGICVQNKTTTWAQVLITMRPCCMNLEKIVVDLELTKKGVLNNLRAEFNYLRGQHQ